MEKTYAGKRLYRRGPQETRRGRQLEMISFPLGGIGTGMVSLGGRGQLQDWEIMNRPAKNIPRPPTGFFALRARTGRDVVIKVLQGPVGGAGVGDGHGAPRQFGDGLPHFENVSFKGSFPFAAVSLRDKNSPVDVTLEAFNPFIPLNDKDSGLPVAILLYHVKNTQRKEVSGTIYGSLKNFVGEPESRENTVCRDGDLTGLQLSTTGLPKDSPKFGNLALASPWPNVRVWPYWKDDSLAKFWEAVAESGELPRLEAGGKTSIGTVAADFVVPAGETVTVPFFIAWHFPTVEHWEPCHCADSARRAQPPTWKNYYATLWDDAWDVARYTGRNLERLSAETRLFHKALFSSTIPTAVLDAVSSQIAILKTTTCLRLEDGTFYGFEGCNPSAGCCAGSCSHVWNYAQALPYLFPQLQRSMRRADYTHNMRDDGMLQFRLELPLGKSATWGFHPAADGQMGGVMQVYREWRISGDDGWLKKMWPATKKALEFAWKYWDADKDGVMEGMQHNTYDIEFYGPNTLTGTLYLGALRAAEEMARYLGDKTKATEYHDLFVRGSRWYDARLFNGEYYEQKVNPDAHQAWPDPYRRLALSKGRDDKFPWPRWQYGRGCISDQLLGQWCATMFGLGDLLNRKNIRRALQSIFRYNWRSSMWNHPNPLRIYAVNEEPGLLTGTWPRGERPGYGFYFSDEIWTGIEYQVASHLIYEGFVDEGLTIVAGVRSRYTGERRNPWDEIECGHYYARAMSSYGLITALSGFSYSAPEQRIGLAPRIFRKAFSTFFSVGSGWGTLSQKQSGGKTRFRVKILHGSLALRELTAAGEKPSPKSETAARLSGKTVRVERAGDKNNLKFLFPEGVVIGTGDQLVVTLT